MKTPIELAEEHGAYGDNGYHEMIYAFYKEQLDAYSRALVAPYVEALEKYRKDEMDGLGAVFNTPAKEALAAHKEMFGDKK